MPFIKKGEGKQFKLFYRPYDDPEYKDDKTMAILAPKKSGAAVPDWWTDELALNMREVDDTLNYDGPDTIFKDATWCDFNDEFVQEMNERDPDEESIAYEDDDAFPEHDELDLLNDDDQRFVHVFKDWSRHYDMDEDDPRVQGPLDVELFGAAFDEFDSERRVAVGFLDKWKGPNLEVGEELKRPRVKVSESLKRHIFHADDKGVYLTVLPSKKTANIYADYHRTLKAGNRLTKELVEANPDAVQCKPISAQKLLEEITPESESEEEFDCQTIISTYSNLENHPEMIEEVKERIRLSGKTGLPRGPKAMAPPPAVRPSVDEAEAEAVPTTTVGVAVEDDDAATETREERLERLSEATGDTTSGRPKGETKDERRERKNLVKEMQRLKREQKKEFKTAFREEETHQRVQVLMDDRQRRTMSLALS